MRYLTIRRVISTIFFEYLGLLAQRSLVDGHRVTNLHKLGLATSQDLFECRIVCEIGVFLGVGGKVEKLRRVIGIIDVLPLFLAQCEHPRGDASVMILANNCAVWLVTICNFKETCPWKGLFFL